MKTPRETAFFCDDVGRLLRTGLLLLALALQGYLSETHHHDRAAASALAGAIAADTGSAPTQPIDSDGHDPHCFICHLSTHGGTSILPPAILLAVGPAEGVAYRVTLDPLETRDAPSAYSSRAPPPLLVQA